MADGGKYVLWGRPSSLNVQKALVALEACGISDFEFVHASALLAPGSNEYAAVDAGVAAVNTDAYRRLNPNPSVPTLQLASAGGGALWESNTIVRYLARKHRPALIGGGSLEAAAAMEKWMDWELQHPKLYPPLKKLHDNVVRLPASDRDAGVIVGSAAAFFGALAIVEAQLEETPFLGGDSFSVADIGLGAFVSRCKVSLLRAREDHGDKLDVTGVPRTPAIDAWYERLLREPAFVAGCDVPERLHASLPVSGELPAWYKAYNAKYNL